MDTTYTGKDRPTTFLLHSYRALSSPHHHTTTSHCAYKSITSSLTIATLTATCYFIPGSFPLFAPCEGSFADDAYFFRQISFADFLSLVGALFF